MFQSQIAAVQLEDMPDDVIAARPILERRSRPRPPRKASCSMRPMRVGDVARALRIAAMNFGSEVNLIARSYVWHFARRAGLDDVSAMWSKRCVRVSTGEDTVSFDAVSSFVHGRDVAWLNLTEIDGPDADLVLDALSQWPRVHRLLVVRIRETLLPLFVSAGFELAGTMPDGNERHYYLHAPRDRLAADVGAPVSVRFGARDLPHADCEFSVIEREGSIIGLSGIYEVEFWRDVTWGAWGAMDPAAARRDAVFDTLRLTEERCRAQGARWFCLETSDASKYRHARRIYELYGLEPLMRIPRFYVDGDGAREETFIVYGKRLDTAAETRARELTVRKPLAV